MFFFSFSVFGTCVCQWKSQWDNAFRCPASIPAETPAVLPTVDFPQLVQMSTQEKVTFYPHVLGNTKSCLKICDECIPHSPHPCHGRAALEIHFLSIFKLYCCSSTVVCILPFLPSFKCTLNECIFKIPFYWLHNFSINISKVLIHFSLQIFIKWYTVKIIPVMVMNVHLWYKILFLLVLLLLG